MTVLPEEEKSETRPKSKFGSMQTTVIGGGPKSARSGFSTATTEVAFSNYDYPKQEGQEDGAILLKVRGKPGIYKRNLLLIPGLTLMLMFTGVDVMQSSVQLLSSTYELENAATVNTLSMIIASIASCFVLIFGGVLYDLLGRAKTVSLMFVVGATACVFIPFGANISSTSDKVIYYTFFKVIYNCTFVPLLMNPFINDYVVVQDRGLAMGLQNFGLTIGNLASVAILFTITK